MRPLAAALLVGICTSWVSPGHAAAQLPLGSLVVTITSPAGGTTVGATVPVAASVSIVGNLTVRGVRFTLDGALLGVEDTTAPYAISWNTRTASNGSHTLRAVARDLLGVTYSSSPITVTVFNDLTPPSVAVASPSSGATVSGVTAVSASASDNVGVTGVQFRLNGVALGPEDTQAPYATSWNTTAVNNGSHALTATARDAAGNTATSAAATVTVRNDTESPAVALTAPAGGATVNGSIGVAAAASDDIGVAGVQFRVDGANLGPEDTEAPYGVPWNTTTASNGSHELRAIARDASGKSTTSAPVTVTVRNDAGPPTVRITNPADGATVSREVMVTADASDDIGVTSVQFFLNGHPLAGPDTTSPYSSEWVTMASPDGSYTLTAVARDAAGHAATSNPVVVTVSNDDSTAPTTTITAPADGATVSGSVTITADASDDREVVAIQITVDGAQVAPGGNTLPHSVTWDTTAVSNGPHTITADARDAAGNRATDTITVTVSNEAASTTTRLQETAPSITYTGSWAHGNGAKAWSGGTASLATGGPDATGSPTRATLTFTGTGVSWIGFRGPQTGIARVFLDGGLAATVDTYSASEALEAALYTVSGLPSATHTLAIESTGTKNAASSDIFIVVDAFDVTSAAGGSDTAPPAVAITEPAAGATVSGTVALAADATDNVGIATVRFFVDGAQVGPDIVSPPYAVGWDTTATAGGSHTLTAEARDAAGNTGRSTAVIVTVSNGPAPPPPSMTTRFEETDLAVTYTPGSPAAGPPGWWHGSRSRGWSGETASFNRSDGGRATFTFTGSSVSWIGFRAPWAGIARVHLDGAFAGEIDLYSATERPQSVVFSASGLAPGTHTIVVESTGRTNTSAVDNAVVVDAFDVGPSRPPTVTGTRIEDTASSVTFTEGWTHGDTSAAWSGGTAAVSTAAGARASVTFTGTSVSLIGLRAPDTGIARVFLDGAFHATVDTFAPAAIQAVVFTETNLAPGSHELAIEVTGQRNASATGHLIVVDAVDVRSRFEETEPSAVYTGTWVQQSFEEAWSGTSATYGSGSAARSTTAGATMAFTFKGSSVAWIGFRGPQAGIARVYVDGVFASEVDAFSPSPQVQAPLFTATGLAGTQAHTLTIEATGVRNPASTNALVVVDAFDVVLPSPAPRITRFQETDAAYPTGTWQQSSANSLYSGGTVALSTTVGARAEFTFTGTSVRWVGQRRRDSGIARVYLDGVLVGEVDTFAPLQDEYLAAVFSRTDLAPGTHVLAIEVTGLKHPGSTGTQVIIDAFDVAP